MFFVPTTATSAGPGFFSHTSAAKEVDNISTETKETWSKVHPMYGPAQVEPPSAVKPYSRREATVKNPGKISSISLCSGVNDIPIVEPRTTEANKVA
ncbi:uncharacterized protein N7477_001289 [Penicillium maclennaniae]|uniref:uncharacterized protein n=1 Tax=Penicillium maclennaniae TaxID=1343394 RepID=UPI00253FD487|nr:uncharacterized protein N7477_001289 [Penicillium maclennaniae]KAJ5681349.1 hypothetical protein N7477_001289 [Penicillium maclennaniae]